MHVPLQGVLYVWLWERLRLSGQVPHQRVPAGTLCQYFAGGSRGSSQKTIGEAASRCPPQGVSGTSLAQSTREGPCNTVSMHKLKRLFVHLWERLPAGILLGVIAQWGRPRSSEPHAGDKNKRGGGGAQVRREISVGATHRRTTVASPILRRGGRTLPLRILLGGSLWPAMGPKQLPSAL